jgi:hypothetical protein
VPEPQRDPRAGTVAGDTTLRVPPVPPGARARLRDGWAYVRLHSGAPLAPPPSHERWMRALWGFAQPLLGIRFLLRDRSLLGEAIAPVFAVAAICAVAAWGKAADDGALAVVVAFAVAFAALAPIPPFIFARMYARLAARARGELGFDPRAPYLKPISRSVGESVAMVITIAIGVAPGTIALGLVPGMGVALAFALQAPWTLHWMVVEALDNGRALAPGESVEGKDEAREHAWWQRLLDVPHIKVLHVVLTPWRMIGEIVEAMTRSWRRELRLVEADPHMALGFGVGTVVLLAVPGLNLLFRPALVIAAAHVRARLEE